jgi:hypothetical protein
LTAWSNRQETKQVELRMAIASFRLIDAGAFARYPPAKATLTSNKASSV